MSKATILTDRFDRALLYATHVHGGQVRKGTNTPYVAHLLAVSATVLEYGGDEDLAIAALLGRHLERTDIDWTALAAHCEHAGVVRQCRALIALASRLLAIPHPRFYDLQARKAARY